MFPGDIAATRLALLAPHLRTISLERGAVLHDVGEELEHVYFPHAGMVSLVAVMQSGATVETATIGRSGPYLAHPGLRNLVGRFNQFERI